MPATFDQPETASGPSARGFFVSTVGPAAAAGYNSPVNTPPAPDAPGSPLACRGFDIVEVSAAGWRTRPDALVGEEPLLIELRHGPPRDRRRTPLAVTLRTPGDDADLATGMLVTEGIVRTPRDILALAVVEANILRVDLHPDVTVDVERLRRHGVVSSACGLCGKTSLDAIEAECATLAGGPTVAAALLHALPAKLRDRQDLFRRTGGLHAAAFVGPDGEIVAVREDVGRHNAVDKLLGASLAGGPFPPVLFVSGRAGLELVQKAAVVGVPIFAAVGAPSSLAVELARRVGTTLVGFVRADRFNIYSHPERIAP